MSQTKPITTCDHCAKVRPEGAHINWDTGWWILTTQYPGEWSAPRHDFCSDTCLEAWTAARIERMKPKKREVSS